MSGTIVAVCSAAEVATPDRAAQGIGGNERAVTMTHATAALRIITRITVET